MQETSWKLYSTSQQAWEAMLVDCAGAKKTIDLEQFILVNDEIGKRFLDLFIEKAKEGVNVRIICDAVGSYSLLKSSYISRLKENGVAIEFHNIIQPWRLGTFTSWFFRDHKKILIVDGEIAHTGGVGIDRTMKNWKDGQVRLEGEVVKEMQFAFNKMWRITNGELFVKTKKPDYTKDFCFSTNSPRLKQRHITVEYIKQIKKAKRYIYITTPYFVPSERFFFLLKKAAKRGVDVKIMIPKKSNHPITDAAARSYFGSVLKDGVKIYCFNQGMIHTKTVVTDDSWCSIGSANFDNLSLLFNYEGNIFSRNRHFIKELKDKFFSDIEFAEELTREKWNKRSRADKFFEFLTWPFHGLL